MYAVNLPMERLNEDKRQNLYYVILYIVTYYVFVEVISNHLHYDLTFLFVFSNTFNCSKGCFPAPAYINIRTENARPKSL
jgi:hypothetical protein